MIDSAELYRLFHQQPFQPMRVHLVDGRVYDIPHERMAFVGDTFFAIGVPTSEYPPPICDHVERVILDNITKVEHISSTTSANP